MSYHSAIFFFFTYYRRSHKLWLDDQVTLLQFLTEEEDNFSLLQNIQTSSWVHSILLCGYWGLFSRM